jgi:Ca2+-binding RTX toxin-like protein
VNATVQVQTADGTATTAGNDYTAAGPTTLTFAPGQATRTFVVNVTGDNTPEQNETFLVNLSAASGATIGDNQASGIITNDDGVSFAINDVTQAEGNGPGTTAFTFVVTMTGATSLTPTVTAQTSNGTATAPGEYTAVGPTILSFAPGVTQRNFIVQVTGDTVFEPNEQFFVDLSAPTDGTIADAQGVGTITNDDNSPVLTINDATITEGNSGTSTATFTVSKTGGTEFNTTVQVQTADQTASAGTDYVAVALSTLTFLPSELTRTVTVTVTGDTTFEANVTFAVNLLNPTNAIIGDSLGVGTITNDDAAPAFSINDVTVIEGNSGTVNAVFTVNKTAAATALNATVQVATADGTATAGTDYVALTTTLTFTPAQTSQTVTVTVNGETAFEADETFFVNLSSPTNATISDNQAIGTITNDDSSNTAPVAVDDTATTTMHTAVVINVISNDTDDKGVIPASVTPAASPNGSLSVNTTTGQITYTPNFGFFGTDQFTYTVSDLEGLPSNPATVTVTVNRADPNAILISLLPDPNNPGETALVILGNDNSGTIRVVKSGDDVKVMAGLGVLGTFSPTGSIVIFGNGGDDKIQIGKGIELPVIVHGGDGNDRLTGGSSAAVLIGGDGNDRLIGGKGRNLLIGGDGQDTLRGGAADDILIGGTTLHDNSPDALSEIMDIWSASGTTYTQRIASIVASPYPLDMVTVFDDNLADTLVGSSGSDWFFFGENDRVRLGGRLLDFRRLGAGWVTTIVPNTLVKT